MENGLWLVLHFLISTVSLNLQDFCSHIVNGSVCINLFCYIIHFMTNNQFQNVFIHVSMFTKGDEGVSCVMWFVFHLGLQHPCLKSYHCNSSKLWYIHYNSSWLNFPFPICSELLSLLSDNHWRKQHHLLQMTWYILCLPWSMCKFHDCFLFLILCS